MADAGFKLKVEGEAEFNAALRQINENIKLNKSEIRMLSEQYNASGGDISKLAEKGEVLQNNISQQTQKVEEMRTMYAKASQTLDEHDTRMVTLKTSINNEAAALAKMTAEFNKNQNAIDESNRSTTQFEDALADIDSMLKVNSSELEKLNSLYGDNAKSADTLNAKEKALTSSIEAQEKKISALKNALAKAEDQYGSSSKEANQYRESINKAESELNTMNKSLEENRTAMNRTSHSGKQFIDTLKIIEDGTGIKIPENIKGMVGGFKNATLAAGGILTAILGVVKAMDKLKTQSEEYYNEINREAESSGISETIIQQFEYIGKRLNFDSAVVTDSLKELKTHMYDSKDGVSDVASIFQLLGVNILDTDGNLKTALDTFYECIDALGNLDNQTERDAITMKLFGESASSLNPLIYAGAETLKFYAQEAINVGYATSEATHQMMNASNAMKNHRGALWDATTRNFGTYINSVVGLISGRTDFGDVFSADHMVSTSFMEWLKARITGFARGTYNAPGGLAVVGEEGPEIVELPTGARVYPHGKAPDGLYGGTTNYYSISIPAKDIKEFNDIIHIAENEKMSKRMGKTR